VLLALVVIIASLPLDLWHSAAQELYNPNPDTLLLSASDDLTNLAVAVNRVAAPLPDAQLTLTLPSAALLVNSLQLSVPGGALAITEDAAFYNAEIASYQAYLAGISTDPADAERWRIALKSAEGVYTLYLPGGTSYQLDLTTQPITPIVGDFSVLAELRAGAEQFQSSLVVPQATATPLPLTSSADPSPSPSTTLLNSTPTATIAISETLTATAALTATETLTATGTATAADTDLSSVTPTLSLSASSTPTITAREGAITDSVPKYTVLDQLSVDDALPMTYTNPSANLDPIVVTDGSVVDLQVVGTFNANYTAINWVVVAKSHPNYSEDMAIFISRNDVTLGPPGPFITSIVPSLASSGLVVGPLTTGDTTVIEYFDTYTTTGWFAVGGPVAANSTLTFTFSTPILAGLSYPATFYLDVGTSVSWTRNYWTYFAEGYYDITAYPATFARINSVFVNSTIAGGIATKGSTVTLRLPDGTVYTTTASTADGSFELSGLPPQPAGTVLTFKAVNPFGSATQQIQVEEPYIDLNNLASWRVLRNPRQQYAEGDRLDLSLLLVEMTDIYGNVRIFDYAALRALSSVSFSPPQNTSLTLSNTSLTISKAGLPNLVIPLQVYPDIYPPPPPVLNPVRDTDTAVTGYSAPNVYINVELPGNVLVAGMTDASGFFNIAIPAQEAGTVIYATATDALYNTSAPGQTTVIPSASYIYGVTAVDSYSWDPSHNPVNAFLPDTNAQGMVSYNLDVISGTWRAPSSARAGDQFTMQLPPELLIRYPATGYFYTADAQIAGTWSVNTSGVVTFTLNAVADPLSEITGTFSLNDIASANPATVPTSGTYPLVYNTYYNVRGVTSNNTYTDSASITYSTPPADMPNRKWVYTETDTTVVWAVVLNADHLNMNPVRLRESYSGQYGTFTQAQSVTYYQGTSSNPAPDIRVYHATVSASGLITLGLLYDKWSIANPTATGYEVVFNNLNGETLAVLITTRKLPGFTYYENSEQLYYRYSGTYYTKNAYAASTPHPPAAVPGSFSFIKRGATDESPALTDALYELYAINKTTLIQRSSSSTTGVVGFVNVQPGIYYLREAVAPAGYRLDPTWYEVIIAQDGAVTINGTAITDRYNGTSYTIYNTPSVSLQLTITKVDELGVPITTQSASFQLHCPTTNVYYNQTRSTALGTGQVTFSNLLAGTYTLYETVGPPGYVKDLARHTLVITDDGTMTLDGTAVISNAVNIANQTIYYQFSVAKVNQSGTPITTSVEFELYDSSDTLVATQLTSSGLVTFTQLRPGNYHLVESAAPEGYLLDSTPRAVVIGADGSVSVDSVALSAPAYRYTFRNLPSLSLAVRSVRQDLTTLITATAAVFQLYDSAMEPIGEPVTTTNGVADLPPIGPGTYYLRQLAAPTGYSLDAATYELTATQNEAGNYFLVSAPLVRSVSGTSGYILFPNTHVPLPNTGGVGTVIFTVAGVLIMLLAVILYLRRRRDS